MTDKVKYKEEMVPDAAEIVLGFLAFIWMLTAILRGVMGKRKSSGMKN